MITSNKGVNKLLVESIVSVRGCDAFVEWVCLGINEYSTIK